jgi:hypothetical protein
MWSATKILAQNEKSKRQSFETFLTLCTRAADQLGSSAVEQSHLQI